MSDLISVIVPVYNVEKYLEKCARSIIGQTYKNLEIIFVNDGSTDGSLNILHRFQDEDSRVKVVVRENGGLSAARNSGIDIATGKYYVFVDSDDYISEKMIEMLYQNLIAYNADISVCGIHWINEGETVEDYLDNSVEVLEGKAVLRKLITDDFVSVVAWNKLYKAELFDTIRYPVGRLHEDQFVIHQILALCERSVYTNAKLYYYIKRAGSISNSMNARNYYDVETAFCERFVWALDHGDKRFTNWCFDAMIHESNGILKRVELEGYDLLAETVKDDVRAALKKIKLNRHITWRKIIVGYIWLKNPKLSSRIRRLLHC